MKKYIDILDGREKEVIVGRFGLDLKKEKNSAKSRKNSGFRGAMCPGLRSVR
ncbi:RNA polymerase sigma-K factor [Bacillus licheniformis]|nr:RNA polymerase sigma-K factor [Bacillus licheniformis]TWM43553.1 RNA polymerase sigma-K factor [Bacillus licheniformis]